MLADDRFPELTQRVVDTTPLGPAAAARLVADVVAYFSESTEEYVRRRHRELQREGCANAEIFQVLSRELGERRVAPPVLTPRQLRRVVYG